MTPKRIINKKALIIIAFVLVVASLTVAITIAYNMSRSGVLNNQFTYATVSCEVTQIQSAQTAEHIKVVNTSDTEVYVRAFFVINYVSLEDPNRVFGTMPVEGDDYMIVYGTGWKQGSDGFFYYTQMLEEGASTDDLIKTLVPILSAPEGYRLNVTAVASAIQAEPYKAVEEAWGVTNNNGIITPR